MPTSKVVLKALTPPPPRGDHAYVGRGCFVDIDPR